MRDLEAGASFKKCSYGVSRTSEDADASRYEAKPFGVNSADAKGRCQMLRLCCVFGANSKAECLFYQIKVAAFISLSTCERSSVITELFRDCVAHALHPWCRP